VRGCWWRRPEVNQTLLRSWKMKYQKQRRHAFPHHRWRALESGVSVGIRIVSLNSLALLRSRSTI
jgi:hypothetical protein